MIPNQRQTACQQINLVSIDQFSWTVFAITLKTVSVAMMMEPLLSAKMLVLKLLMGAANLSMFTPTHVRLPAKMIAAEMLIYVWTVMVTNKLASITRMETGCLVQIQHFHVGFQNVLALGLAEPLSNHIRLQYFTY